MIAALRSALLRWLARELKDHLLHGRVAELEIAVKSVFNMVECAKEGHVPMKLPPGLQGVFEFRRNADGRDEVLARVKLCARCKALYWEEVVAKVQETKPVALDLSEDDTSILS